MNWFRFIEKIKPDGKAFRSIEHSKILFEVMADAFQMVIDYAILSISDQVWYTNTNFDPSPWEARYGIAPPQFATLEQRRIVVKSYMLYPQSANRLSKDYIQSEIINAGFADVLVEYNSAGASDGLLHANDFADEKIEFSLGSLTYNSFIISGNITASYYNALIVLVMGLKPLQVALYDKVQIALALAYDDNFALAIDDNYTFAIDTL